MSVSPWRSALADRASHSTGWPKTSTAMMARLRPVTRRAVSSGSRVYCSASMSANTGLAPTYRMALMLAAKVNEGTRTSSPGPHPRPFKIRCSAAVPELTATAWGTPRYSAMRCSNSSALGPSARRPERRTSATASTSVSSISGADIEIAGLEIRLSEPIGYLGDGPPRGDPLHTRYPMRIFLVVRRRYSWHRHRSRSVSREIVATLLSLLCEQRRRRVPRLSHRASARRCHSRRAGECSMALGTMSLSAHLCPCA